MRDIYTTKNNLVDKHPRTSIVLGELDGDGIGFSPSNQTWKHNRSVLSQAFYNDKLRTMTEIVIYQNMKKIDSWKEMIEES